MENIRGSNPMLREKVFERISYTDEIMTIDGTVNKLIILLVLFLITAGVSWYFFPLFDLVAFNVFVIIAFILGILTSLKPYLSPYTTPLYVTLEGLSIGFLSRLLDMEFKGIVLQAVLLTIAVFAIMLIIYKSRIIKVSNDTVKCIIAITGSIALVYLIDLILMSFGLEIPFLHSNGTVGIIVNLCIVLVAAANFLQDFYFIEEAAYRQTPKYMEWYLAFGVFLTLVWLYLEVLKLLAKLNSQKRNK